MRRILALIATGALLLAGCTGPAPSPPAPTAPTSTLGLPTVPASTPPPITTLAFAGDVHFTGKTLKLLDDPATAFGPVADVLRSADLAMINLETAVTDRGTPAAKEYTFRAPPSAFAAIKAAGVDAVSQANNHALDYGQVGLADALAASSAAGVPIVGAGENAAAAWAPWITTVHGSLRVAVLAFSQVEWPGYRDWEATDTRPGMAYAVTDEEIARAAAAVRAARAQADVVVVFMHWGIEPQSCPDSRQKAAAAAFAAAGATVVVGTHTHVLQGEGWLGNTYVAYGMSNFIWYSDTSPSFDTGVVRVTLTGSTVTGVEFVPAIIDPAGQPIPVSGAEADRIRAKVAGLRECTGLAAP